jgi:hypothetical protein
VRHTRDYALLSDWIGLSWEQTPGQLFGESLGSVISVRDRHVPDGIGQSVKFQIRVRLDQAGQEDFETRRGQTRYVWHFVQLRLNEVMLAFKPTEHDADRGANHATAKDQVPRIDLVANLGLLKET